MTDQPADVQTTPSAGPMTEPTELPEFPVHGISNLEPEVPGPDHAGGHVPSPAPSSPANFDCKGFTTLIHAGSGGRCGRKALDDPVDLVSPILAMVGGLLIVAGAMTLIDRGPARWFRTTSRSRRAIAAMRRKRRFAAAVLMVIGFGCAALIFI